MKNYYKREEIRKTIIEFTYSGSLGPQRECAFFNEDIGQIQRRFPSQSENSALVIDSQRTFHKTLRSGGIAFYSSYWRYYKPSKAEGKKGRDLAWSLKSEKGGISLAKKSAFIFAKFLEKKGFPNPLIKYSGKQGFDFLIPLEKLNPESQDNLGALSNIQKKLTKEALNHFKKRGFSNTEGRNFQFILEGGNGTCLLTELKWNRGLMLSPMSLHPDTKLVSLPLTPPKIPKFSVIDASPDKVRPRKWSIEEEKTEILNSSYAENSPEWPLKA